MDFPIDYIERVYAGVLGKIIGVYLGRPFEGWEYERIIAELGEIWTYVNEKRGLPLIVTDDDISGTFTFIRALEDYNFDRDITAAQIGQTWLNYLIEGKTILSWAGLGCSTEHTAYLRLKNGIPAPLSGSIEMNGPIIAQQIGSQIFIDGWAMVAPGNPEFAADLAKRAASVSHDGEAIFGAQFLAAMEAQAFVESDRYRLIETGLRLIPSGSHMFRMISDLRDFHSKEKDWRKGRQFIADHYGYTNYLGGCHIVPNSALIVLGLLYGDDDFQKSLMITNTSGWDTDCNSGNLGCLLGIKNGLAGIDSSPVDWRSPVADRLYLPSADGGRAVSDAAREAIYIANLGLRLAGQPAYQPKADASPGGFCHFHFDLPGSVQGFRQSSETEHGRVSINNVAKHSRFGQRLLRVELSGFQPGQNGSISTPTFLPPESLNMHGYGLLASPKLYPGQTIYAYLEGDDQNLSPANGQIFIRFYEADSSVAQIDGPPELIPAGKRTTLTWRVPETNGAPIFEVGLSFSANGVYYVDALTWDGCPDFTYGPLLGQFRAPGSDAKIWRQAWVNGVQHWEGWSDEPYRIVQNEGRGMLISGAQEWSSYILKADIRPAFLAHSGGIAANVQGTRRFYGLIITHDQTLQLVKELDGRTVLAEAPYAFDLWQNIPLKLEINSEAAIEGRVRLRAWAGGRMFFDIEDQQLPLTHGGIALVIEEGHLLADRIQVGPIGGLMA